MYPAPADSGYLFQRMDLPTQPIIQARLENVVSTHRSTKLGYDNISITLTEHLLAALRGMDIDNCLIQVEGPEIPILDGSAFPFCEAIAKAGIMEDAEEADRMYIVLGKADIPLELSVDVDFTSWSKAIGVQYAACILEPEEFITKVAPARTFALMDEIQELQRVGILKGVSSDNTILIPHDTTGLRFHNEFARHKLLDVIGDMALLGKPVVGTNLHFEKPGHTTNIAWCKKLVQGLGSAEF